MNDMTPEQKKRRFRALTREENILTGRELLEDLEQPFLFTEFKGIQGPCGERRAVTKDRTELAQFGVTFSKNDVAN
jgi:hypothetical protein